MSTLPYGLRDVKLTPYATNNTLGTPVDLPNSRTLSFSEAEEFTELRGDDKVVATRGQGPQVEWELEAGGLSFEAYRVMAGGTITSSGITPNKVETYTKKTTDSRPYFKIEGQAISDSGGDVHCVLYRAKVNDTLEGEFGDGEFFLTSGSGIAIGTTIAGKTDTIYEFVANETVTPIPAS